VGGEATAHYVGSGCGVGYGEVGGLGAGVKFCAKATSEMELSGYKKGGSGPERWGC
jgi:hypothetical protein